MNTVVSRTCTELCDAEAAGGDAMRLLVDESRPLSEFRSTPAYVLLGDPGAGKTTEFDWECEALGDAALMLPAWKFIASDPDSHPEWRDRVLFIDGLDEIRAGREDSRVPLDAIHNRLDRLRLPGFRVSCREADWLGHSDRQSLMAVSPDSRIIVLRLDELDDRQVTALLHQHNRSDAREFIDKARQHGVGGLLVNPLTLRCLVDAVRQGGDWPDSRLKTLERACRQIATEHNPEHRTAKRPPPLQTVVDAAGYLCALQLLSGIEGYSLPSSVAVPSFLSLTELGEPPARLSRDDFEHALTTKLFRAGGEGFVPLHRQVAEFLAGRHLAKLIGGGLPARRVTALMISPSDDRVVTSLRGLSAWLAAHSREARPLLIDADPVGVGLYGDIGSFTTGEKERLMESLSTLATEAPLLGQQRQDGRSYGYRYDTAWAFRSLAAADMVPTMRELLSRASTGAAEDRVTTLILEVLSHADDPQSVASLLGDLEAVLSDGRRTSTIRTLALDACERIIPSGDERREVLKRLLEAIHDGLIPDPDSSVCGALLNALYPETITPAEVWRYVLSRNGHVTYGRFWSFWDRTLVERSSDQDCVELLDSLHNDAPHIIARLDMFGLEDVPARLLVRCLGAFGENCEPDRLYAWLTVAANSHRRVPGELGREPRVVIWLKSHPQLQKEVVLTWLRQRDPDDLAQPVGHRHCHALHGATPPPDFGLWCLDQAIQIGDAEPEVSQGLLWQAYRSLREPSPSVGLTLETLRDRTRGHPALAQHLDEFCGRRSPSEPSIEDAFHRKMEERQEQRDEEQRQLCEDWAKHLREQETELRESRFSPQNLSTLADVYLGLVVGVDPHTSPRDRISDFVGGDPCLVDAVMVALGGAVSRDDVPEVRQTISWSLESKHSWLARPVLASLRLLDKEDSTRLDALPEAQKRKALAIYYCVSHGSGTPRWHCRWLQHFPETVLDVLYRCAVADVRAGKEIPSGLNDLDGAAGHDDRAHEVGLRLLEAFPTRSSKQQLPVLDRLLARALDHPDKTALLALAQRKQASKSMPVAQRVRWWATDALVVQGTRLQQLNADLAGREVRVRHLAEFLRSVWDRHGTRSPILATIRDPSTLREMIEILGRWCAAPRHGSGFVTLEMEMSDLISSLIGQLSSEPGDEAQRALADLVQHPELEGWHPHLKRALDEQRVIHRDASYSHPSIEQVQDTLTDGPPADAADLRALLEDRLNDMCEDLRGGNSDFWRQFWNEDSHGRPTGAKPENSCRAALLANLQLRLPADVDAAREGPYAADTRADIRVSYGGFNVPIEIKKDSHRDLWRALRDQLMAQYTTDPATDGYGIYLVLWFADPDRPVTRHPGGNRPNAPEELKHRLEQTLTADEARKISVVVMDVTKPGGESAEVR